MEQENQLGSLQNTAAHTSREDTHTDALFHPPKRHLVHCWQGRPLGLGEGLKLIYKYCVPPHSALLPQPESQALLSVHPASESLRRPAIGEPRHALGSLDDRAQKERVSCRETGESHDTADFPTLSSMTGFLQAKGAPWADCPI